MYQVYQQIVIGIGEAVVLSVNHNNKPGIPAGSSIYWTQDDSTIAGSAPFLVGKKVGTVIAKAAITAPGQEEVYQWIVVTVVAQNYQIVPIQP